MTILHDFSLLHTLDQWGRVAHQQTTLDLDNQLLQLAWHSDEAVSDDTAEMPQPAGMAFDPWCRLYRCLPEAGQVERIRDPFDKTATAQALFEVSPQQSGDFQPQTAPQALQQPSAVAVDNQGNLFIVETAARRVLIYDLLRQQLLQSIDTLDKPLDVCCDGNTAFVLTQSCVISLQARGDRRTEALPESIHSPAKITLARDGTLYVLNQAGSEQAHILSLSQSAEAIAVPFAGDLLFSDATTLVVARRPGEDFLRFKIESAQRWNLPHFKALHYDGQGIVLTPQGAIGYWTDRGFRLATRARLRYLSNGRIVSFRLDSDEYQNHWGRVFIDACIPRETSLSIAWLALDELPANPGPELARTPPENAELLTVNRPDLSPPMPPQKLLDELEFYPLHRRSLGNEQPWLKQQDKQFATYEAPVINPPGRYLWLVIELQGSSRFTPKIRSVRVEHHSHELLQRLPKLYSRDTLAADFLRRYLAIMEGSQRDLDQLASRRHLMLDPGNTPAELLPWLSGFVGLVLDRRWSEAVRRRVIEEAIWLFRFRGTLKGLKRFLDLYLQLEDEESGGVIIIEHFRVRGLGGVLVGESDAQAANSVLGAGFRIGGRIGSEEDISINQTSLLDAFTTHAHRFTVVVPVSLDAEKLAVIETILQQHRPAHTIYEICSVDSGMRVGSGLHIGLTSLVGNSSGFGQLQLGESVLGRNDLLGQSRPGFSPANDALGVNSRVG